MALVFCAARCPWAALSKRGRFESNATLGSALRRWGDLEAVISERSSPARCASGGGVGRLVVASRSLLGDDLLSLAAAVRGRFGSAGDASSAKVRLFRADLPGARVRVTLTRCTKESA